MSSNEGTIQDANNMLSEKKPHLTQPVPNDDLSSLEAGTVHDLPPPTNVLQRIAFRMEELSGMEARGIERVPESLRKQDTTFNDYLQMIAIWFSANLTGNNLLIGLLGPTLFELSLTDSLVIGPFAAFFGAACSGYISSFGPISGNRTLVICRYTMGWWPSRLCVLLNIVIMVGYGLIDVLLAGQILSAVNGAGLTVITGVIISSVITIAIVVFGIRLFHQYERYAWIPQLMMLFILAGVAGPYFDTTITTQGDRPVKQADQMSYFWVCMAGTVAWAPASADFYVYFPPTTKRWMTFVCTTIGIGLAVSICILFGAGLGSGVVSRPSWSNANDVSLGALVVEAFAPLGTFGHFCSVIIALGPIANNVPGTYSAALSFQLLGRWMLQIPRLFWSIIAMVIYTVCACAGRNILFTVFSNFLALMGYWTFIWVAIVFEEEFIFRRRRGGYDWSAWNDRSKLPIGIAALIAFLVGWVGAILGMWQTYYTGPLARLVGYGIDLGMPVGASWGALLYPPLRWLELKYVGR